MKTIKWRMCGKFTDILFHKAGGIAKITINRPEVRNAFRPQTVAEMMRALDDIRSGNERGRLLAQGAFRVGQHFKVARVPVRRKYR